MCCPLRKNKECAKLIVVIHVIPAHNTEDFLSLQFTSATFCSKIGADHSQVAQLVRATP